MGFFFFHLKPRQDLTVGRGVVLANPKDIQMKKNYIHQNLPDNLPILRESAPQP